MERYIDMDVHAAACTLEGRARTPTLSRGPGKLLRSKGLRARMHDGIRQLLLPCGLALANRGAVSLTIVFVALTAGCQPTDERPGLWLSGRVEAGPVRDWSFSEEIEEIFVETRTWYGVPHSVTIWGAAQGGHFYLPSLYYGAEEFPSARFWNRNVVRDPRVRVEIGDRVFEGTAELVTDESEWNRAAEAFRRKYPAFEEYRREPGAKWIFLRFEPGSTG